jgi:hypothetical protein
VGDPAPLGGDAGVTENCVGGGERCCDAGDARPPIGRGDMERPLANGGAGGRSGEGVRGTGA